MTEFELSNFKNHLLFKSDDKIFLLDTGTPSTVSSNGQLFFLDERLSVQKDYLGFTTDKLSEYVGTKIDVLLGGDILSNLSILINVKLGKVSFSKESVEKEGEKFSFEVFMGIPIISFNFNDKSCRGFLDTGAALSYIKVNMTNGLKSAGNKTDFYPGYGQFTTQTYQIPIQVSGRQFSVIFGNLPSILETTLMMAGVDGIIGFDFFNSFNILMNYQNKTITLL